MTKNKALALAALTAWPFVVPVIGWLFEVMGMMPSAASDPPAVFVLYLGILFLTPIVVLALLVFYLAYLFTRPQLSLDRKLVWAAILVIGHVFSMPVFWYLFIWKPRYIPPMQAASRFNLLVYGPLQLGLLLPLMYLFPMTLSDSVAVSSNLDSSEIAETAAHWAWVVGPTLGVTVIFVVGKLCYALFLWASSRQVAWIVLWGVFAVISLPVIWYATVVLRSMLPTDAPPNTLSALTKIALVLALVAQPVLLGWLLAASWKLRSFKSIWTEENSL